MNLSYKAGSSSFFIALLLSLILFGCGGEMQRNLRPVPLALGDLNQLVVIADDNVWQGPVGDTVDYYYSSAFPILPQPEPILDLNHFSADELAADPMRKELRNYLIIGNLNDPDSPTTKLINRDLGEEKIRRALEDTSFTSMIGRDKWAEGQLVIYLFAKSEDVLLRLVKRNFPAVLKKIYEADQKKLDATVYLDGESPSLQQEVLGQMGINLRIPNDYVKAINDSSVIWLRKETPKYSSNILIHKLAYTDQRQLSKEGLKLIRDSLGRKYISSTLPNTYMKINDVDLPLLISKTTIDNHYALEARGIWEIENDYMGGAFISYLILDSEKNELIFLDGFLHAPGEDKRNRMQYLEHILKTARI